MPCCHPTSHAPVPACSLASISPLYRLYTGSEPALYRLYTGSIPALYWLYTGSVSALRQLLYRVYTGDILVITRAPVPCVQRICRRRQAPVEVPTEGIGGVYPPMAPGRCGPFIFFILQTTCSARRSARSCRARCSLCGRGSTARAGDSKIGSAVGRHRARPAGARRKGLILTSQPVRSSSISTAVVDKQPLAGRGKFWWSRGGVWVESCQPVRSSSIGSR